MAELLEINRITRDGRPAKWGIDYRSPWELNPDGSRQRKKRFFRTKKEREDEVESLLERFGKFGASAGQALTPLEAEDYRAAKALLPEGVTVREAARVYLQSHRPDTPKMATVFDSYEASMKASGSSAGWIREVRYTFKMFAAAMPEDAKIGQITTEAVRTWMKSLEAKFRDGRRVSGYADESRNNFRRRLHAFFEYALKERSWTHLTENPIARVEVPAVNRGAPAFYSVVEARAMLGAAALHIPDIVPFLVLRMFGGIRRAEIMRMEQSDIDADRRLIDLPGFRKGQDGRMQRVTKSGKGRIIEDLPPVIWDWLKRFPVLKVANQQLNFRLLFRAAHVRQLRNGFRHSFPTYHVALKQNAAHTILILGQEEDSKVFYAHYRNPRITKEEAEAYFGLGPDNVLPLIGLPPISSEAR